MKKITKVTVNGKDLSRETMTQTNDYPWERATFKQFLDGDVVVEDENGNKFTIKGATRATLWEGKRTSLELGFGKDWLDSKELGFALA